MAVNEHGRHGGPADEADARIARIYREASREEPPARLDRALAAAAREPAGGIEPRRSAWWTAWRVPFAFAAVAVVSVSLVALMMEQDGERLTRIPQAAVPSPPDGEAAPPERAPMQVPPAQPQAREERKATPVEPPRSQPGSAEPPVVAHSVPPPVRRDDSRNQGYSGPAEQSAPMLQKAPAPEAPPSAAQDAAMSAEASRDRQESRALAAEDRPAAAAAAAASKPAPAPAAGSVGGLSARRSKADAAPVRLSPEVARHVVELESRPPSAWLDRILSLRREGRSAEADALLAEFKRRFPLEALPAELQ